MKYEFNNEIYDVLIEKKLNKNTYIRVKEDLTIHVTTNYLITNKQIKKLLDDNTKFLEKSIKRQKEKLEKENLFCYLGKVYDIIIIRTKDIEFIDNRIYVKSMDYLNKWCRKQMKKLFQERLDYNYTLFEENIPYPNLRIREMKTRWGVCNRSNLTITLNSNLIKYDIEKLDYVIIHELSHLVHFNHSKEFWNLVNKYCPNYKRIRKELRD